MCIWSRALLGRKSSASVSEVGELGNALSLSYSPFSWPVQYLEQLLWRLITHWGAGASIPPLVLLNTVKVGVL